MLIGGGGITDEFEEDPIEAEDILIFGREGGGGIPKFPKEGGGGRFPNEGGGGRFPNEGGGGKFPKDGGGGRFPKDGGGGNNELLFPNTTFKGGGGGGKFELP